MPGDTEEHPERIDAEQNRGSLMVSEHLARYLWSAQLVDGLNVLDAGCGTGYGIRILEGAGAARVVGVDIAEEAVSQAAAANTGPRVEVRQGDVRELPFSDGEFDLVVCFEVIEHVAEPDVVLDELARVLGPDGMLCISTPNKLVYPSGNPYHLHEYEPEEFTRALNQRFSNLALHRQTAWLASTILSDAEFAAAGSGESFSSRTVKAEPNAPGEEVYTIALASRGAVSPPRALLSLGESFEVSWWQEQVEAAGAKGHELASQALEQAAAERELALAESAAHERDATAQRRNVAIALQRAATASENSRNSAKRLLQVEENLAQSKARIFALEEALDGQAALAEELRARVERADHVMAALKASISWRITAPLRVLKRRR